MRKWVGILAVGTVLAVLLSTAACTRSKLGAAPSPAAVGQVTVAAQTTAVPTAGKTVISAEATATKASAQAVDTTPTSEASPTPIPSMTPTVAVSPMPTETPVPGATATLTTEPSPTPTAVATPTGTAEFEYTVKTGDTLWGIALRFGTTVEKIKSRNGLTSDVIYRGSKLIIPGTSAGEQVTHVVQPGENLFRIALNYGTTVEAIAAANNIVNPSYVYAGQTLLIVKGGSVPGGTAPKYHVVQPGETLWSIAMRYGTTPWKIAAANGIANINFIYAGRTLRIP